MMVFANREDAGRRLAGALRHLVVADPVVVGLPRGGVPVAFEVAQVLQAPLDVVVVRKLGVPGQPELAMGAVGEGGVRVVDDRTARLASPDEFARIERRALDEVQERARRFRGDRPRIPLAGRTVVVVDDGSATGSTARAACQVVRALGAARVVLAAPVAPAGVPEAMRPDADEVVCLGTPAEFFAIGQFYADFRQTRDEHVVDLLHRAAGFAGQAPAEEPPREDGMQPRDDEIEVQVAGVRLGGHLTVPRHASGVVVFAHGSGSSRHSPRNRFVAAQLTAAGLGTLLFDLLAPAEERDRTNVFDIDLLAGRLREVTAWLRAQPRLGDMPIGYFGASTGAAAALAAAADPDSPVAAVVSRGGRPDLAGRALAGVRASTLLIVGGHDDVVLDLNRAAQGRLRCESELAVVPGATHLFEEPGALEEVARLAAEWFAEHLTVLSPTP